MQRDGIRLQPAGKKTGRNRHPVRREDDRPFLPLRAGERAGVRCFQPLITLISDFLGPEIA